MAKAKKDKRLQKVKVTWTDITSYQGWRPVDAALSAPALYCKTVGWLLSKTKQEIRVCGSLALSDDGKSVELVSDITIIPRANVRKIEAK
jgi:hypothetical protein